MQVSADRKCFVCGPENPIGLKTEFRINNKGNRAEATLSLSDHYQGWQGVVHGGIISALLDEAAIYACRSVSLHAVTTGLTVRFRKPVATGAVIVIQAEVDKIRRNLAIVNSVLMCGDEIMAEAEIKILLMDKSREGQ